MTVINSDDLVLPATGDNGANNPIIGWHNLVTVASISADSEDPEFPVSNLANPATHLIWQSLEDSQQDITVEIDYDGEIDYVAFAKHNFGSAFIEVTIEGSVADSPAVFSELVQPTVPDDDHCAIFRFVPQQLSQIRIGLQGSVSPSDPPFAAVLYIGKLLVLPRKIYQGHTPITLGRKAKILTGMSESGNFLGRVVLNEHLESTASLSLIRPDFYRAQIDPFIAFSKEDPFFFAWRPESYPLECGYAWMINDPQPVNEAPSGLISLDLQMRGIA